MPRAHSIFPSSFPFPQVAGYPHQSLLTLRAELPLLVGLKKNEEWVSKDAGAALVSIVDESIESAEPMHGEVSGCWKVHASGPDLRFSYAAPVNRQRQKCTGDNFVSKLHLKFFLMGGSLSCLGVHSFLQIIKSNSKDGDQAGRGSIGSKLTDYRTTNQVESGFSRTAFCQRISLVAFVGRPYNRTWLGSTRL